MKRSIAKRLEVLLLIGMTAIIFTSCIETEQNISYKDGWYYYDCRFSVDKSLGLFLGEEEGPFADIDADAQEPRKQSREYDNEMGIDIRKIDDYTVDIAVSIYKWTTNQELRDLLPKTEHRTIKIPLVTNLLAYILIQEIFQDSQQDETDKAMGELLLSDYYWTIHVEENILPHGASRAYLADKEEWERTQVACERFGRRLTVKIPMEKFMDGTNYTHLVIY